MRRIPDWTSSSSDDLGAKGVAGHTRYLAWTENAFIGGHGEYRLYCFSNVVTLFCDGFEYSGDASRWSSVVP